MHISGSMYLLHLCVYVSYLKILTSAGTSGERWSGACYGNQVKKGVFGASETFWWEGKEKKYIYFLLAMICLVLQCLSS